MLERSNIAPHPDGAFLSTPEAHGGVAWLRRLARERAAATRLPSGRPYHQRLHQNLSSVKKDRAQFAIERSDNECVNAIEQADADERHSAQSVHPIQPAGALRVG